MKVAVIADDLTGANDTGVQFAKLGLRTLVVLSASLDNLDLNHFDAVVVNTDSRAMDSQLAYSVTSQVSRELRGYKPCLVYKKFDSTLRGNIAIELDAIMEGFGFNSAVVAPAFPQLGRTTEGGTHLVNGIPVAETEAAKDLRMPVYTSDLADTLRVMGGRDVKNIFIQDINHLAEIMHGKDNVIWACDAKNGEHLNRIASLAPNYGAETLFAGSAGLAEFLPQQMGWASAPREFTVGTTSTQPTLLVAGSMSKKTKEQLEFLRKVKPDIYVLSLSAKQLVPQFTAERFGVELAGLCANLQLNQPAVVMVEGDRISGQSQVIALNLGMFVRELLSRVTVKSLVMTGGDIAGAVCNKLDVVGLKVLSELEVGIPFGKIVGGAWNGLSVITKAGAFGAAESLARIIALLDKGALPE